MGTETRSDEHPGSGWTGIEHVQAVLGELPGGSLLGHLVDTIPGVQIEKAAAMLERLLEFVRGEPDAFADRLRREPRLARLVWKATRAAADAELDAKINALARAAAMAAQDDSKIDESLRIVDTLSHLDTVHVRALALMTTKPDGGDAEKPTPIEELLGVDPAIAVTIAGDLMRLSVTRTPGMGFSGLSDALWLSDYGVLILELLEIRTKERWAS